MAVEANAMSSLKVAAVCGGTSFGVTRARWISFKAASLFFCVPECEVGHN
jgi:hypothetical protein